MIRRALTAVVVAGGLVVSFLAAPGRPAAFDSGRQAFAYIYGVATHPRCLNCHGTGTGAGSRPLVGDRMEPHPMNITIAHNPGGSLGIDCGTCHQDRNLPDRGTPPGFSNTRMRLAWQMPADDSMRVWPVLQGSLSEGQKQREVCRAWDKFRRTRGPGALPHHVADDPLIEWARTKTPAREAVASERLGEAVEKFNDWLERGGSCDDLAR